MNNDDLDKSWHLCLLFDTRVIFSFAKYASGKLHIFSGNNFVVLNKFSGTEFNHILIVIFSNMFFAVMIVMLVMMNCDDNATSLVLLLTFI